MCMCVCVRTSCVPRHACLCHRYKERYIDGLCIYNHLRIYVK